MTTRRRLVCSLFAVLVLLTACDGDGDGGSNGPSPSAGASGDTPSPAPVDERAERIVEEQEQVSPGKHVVGTFEPRFSFTFAGVNQARATRQTDRLLILDMEVPRQLVFSRPDSLYIYGGGTPVLVQGPVANLEAWLASIPHLEIQGRSSTSIGGEPGRVVDVLVTSVPEQEVGDCPIPCVPLVPLGIGDKAVFLTEGQEARFIFLSAGTEQMFVLISATERDFQESVGNADALLGTVKF